MTDDDFDDEGEMVAYFATLDQLCEFCGWDDEIKAQIARDMQLTMPREPEDTLQ